VAQNFQQLANVENVSVGLYLHTEGLDLRRIEKSESYPIVVLAQERLHEGWLRIKTAVEEDVNPHRITNSSSVESPDRRI